MNIQVVMPSTTHSTHVYTPVVHTLNGSILDKVIIHTSSWIHWKVILAPKCLTKPKCAIWIFVGVSNLNLIYDFSMWGAMRLLVKLTRYESLDFFKVFFGGDLWCICSPNYLVLGGLECSLLGAISPVKWLRFDLSMSKIHNKGPYKKKGQNVDLNMPSIVVQPFWWIVTTYFIGTLHSMASTWNHLGKGKFFWWRFHPIHCKERKHIIGMNMLKELQKFQ